MVCWLFVATQHDCPVVQLVFPHGSVLGLPTSFSEPSFGGDEPSFVGEPSLFGEPSFVVVASLLFPESPLPASPSVVSAPPHATRASAQKKDRMKDWCDHPRRALPLFLVRYALTLAAILVACGGHSRTPPHEVAHAAPVGCDPRPIIARLTPQAKNDDCIAVTHHRGPLDHCVAHLLGNGSTALVSLITECGGDSCSVESWVCSPATNGLVHVNTGGGGVAASPAGDFLVVDEDVGPVDTNSPFDGRVRLARLDIATGARSPFADCVAPVLSPGGNWIACRNHAGDVLRVPIRGGAAEVVARSGADAAHVPWKPYAYIWPNAVEFPSRDVVTFVTLQENDKSEVQTLAGRAAWRE